MTFKDVAFKNFRAHIKKYLSYFLCSSFSIMIFFMYSTLLFNDKITLDTEFNALSIIFNISMTTVVLFSIFFINYAHSAFVKSRYKEFGIYMTLGMTSKDIRKIILLENVIIIFSSMIVGLISGLIFSRLFQMVVIKLLDISGVGYSLSYKCFVITIAIFATIFASVIIISRFSNRKLEISELIRLSRKGDVIVKGSLVRGFVGLTLIIASVAVLYYITHYNRLITNPLAILSYLVVCFTGVYMTIAHLGKTILGLFKRRSNFYYKNVLAITEVSSKFNQNKKVVFILSILSAMIIFFVASAFSLYSQSVRISGMAQPNHLEYAEIEGINNLPANKLDSILKESGITVESKRDIEFIQLGFEGELDKNDLLLSKPVISQSIYKTLTKKDITVEKGSVINIITAWEPGFHGIAPSSTIKLKSGEKIFEFTVQDSLHSDIEKIQWIVGLESYPSSSGIVLNDEDYEQIKAMIQPENIGMFHLINFNDWKNTGGIVQEVKKALEDANSKNSKIDKNRATLLTTGSRIKIYKDLKQGYALFIFVSSVMGLLFFMAAGSVLYFKQYTEIGNAKAKFFKLYKLGIREKEATAIITNELRLTFFIPLILGGIMGYSFMYLMAFLNNGQAVIGDFMKSATAVVAAYFMFQTVFYLMTKKKYVKEVLVNL